MGRAAKRKIRAIWTFEYDPDQLEYPEGVRTLVDQARVDLMSGQFETFIQQGEGRFRFEVTDQASGKPVGREVSVSKTWART